MKKTGKLATLILMFSSIALLLILQFFWIRGAYTKALDDLKRETTGIFRMTIFAMRDSVIQQTLDAWPVGGAGTPTADSVLRSMFHAHPERDSIRFDDHPRDEKRKNFGKGRKVHIEMMSSYGNIEDSLRVRLRSFSRSGEPRRNLIFRLGPDSLHIDSIAYYYKRALKKANIDLPVQIIHARRGDHRNGFSRDTFVTEAIRMNPAIRYAAVISGFNSVLMRQIMPQALFSLFLTLLTSVSFYVMYRNIRQQQKLVELKNDFISNITHELKTPITTVSVAIEALRNFKGLENPQLTNEYLTIAQNELNRLTILTDKVLKTAIFEDKGVSFEPEQLDLSAMIEQIIASMKLVFEKNRTNVIFNREGESFILAGDRDHLTNVIYNLLDNALKYSVSPATVTVSLKEHSGSITLSVQDTGLGIPQEYQKKIFEKFFRVPTGDVHNIKGYGLGLSYVDSVIRQHRGTITVVSAEGKGSTFVIDLPKA